ncbi:MAG: ABC transporter ATP-binding protein/permease, partial [Prevotellaceae bacterium]|nr:ABC transporter ATP-binding protein/permease [Prevotellaceae bacterium]
QSTLRQQIRHRTVYSSTSATLINLGFSAGYLVTFLWGARGLHHDTITYGTMIAFIQLVGQIQLPIRELTRFVPLIIGSFTAGERLMELEDTPLEPEGEPRLFPDGAGVRLKDVSYTYPGNPHPTISHLSFSFPPGSRTAIVGETGAGKTTLIRLMLALIEPEEGTVEVFNRDDSCAASPQTRCNMLYVPQGNTLLSGTIRYNLQLGNPKATQREMEEALRVACADFALSLPEGLDSPIGEQGVGLSQGQAQRLCIARALLGKGQILLLDEATSALDTETESRLLDNLTHWMLPSQTLIFVTHRAAAAEQCTQSLRL